MNRLLLAMLLLVSALPVRAAGVAGMFGEGRSQFSLEAGNAYAFDNPKFLCYPVAHCAIPWGKERGGG